MPPDAQVFFLSDGIPWHSDPRRNSMAAAVDWALQHQLQGVVLESGALRNQHGAAAAARRQGLQVMRCDQRTMCTDPKTCTCDKIGAGLTGLRHRQCAAAAAPPGVSGGTIVQLPVAQADT